MADQKLTDLTALSAAATNDDILYIVDDPAGGANSRKVTRANLLTGAFSMTGDLTFNGAFHPIIDPGADQDANLIEIDVTGTPVFSWDESEDGFSLNKGLLIVDADGIDINPGTDTDTDLITVGVTGAPVISWDESEDAFSQNKGLRITSGNLGIGVTDPDELLHIESSTSAKPVLKLENTTSDNSSAFIEFLHTRGGASSNTDDKLAQILFRGNNATPAEVTFARVEASTRAVGAGTEDGMIEFSVNTNGSILEYMRLDGLNSNLVINQDSNDIDTRIEGANDVNLLVCNAGSDAVGIGKFAPSAKLHIDQTSATGAKPVLLLDQADVSEEMIELTCAVGVGNAIEAVGAKTLTTTHFIKVTITGVGTRYFPVGTIA